MPVWVKGKKTMACGDLIKWASASGALTATLLAATLSGCSDSAPTGRMIDPNKIQPSDPNQFQGGGDGMGPAMALDVGNPEDPVAGPATMMGPVDDEACGEAALSARRVLPSVMILLDGSQSMLDPYGEPPLDDAGVPTGPQLNRWQAAREALINPVDGVVVQLQELVRFGIAIYGTMPTCPLPITPIDPELNNYDAIAAVVPNMPPGRTTPTGAALDAIVQRLPDPALALDVTIGPQIIILATDGDPNSCMEFNFATDYGPSIQAAMAAKAKNQRIYVVSVGQDAAAQHLQEMANLGAGLDINSSTPADVYYPEDPGALADTLAALIGDELSCEVALEGEGVMEMFRCNGTVTMTIGDQVQELECDGDHGWKLIDPTHIEIQGDACEAFKGAIDARLEAKFPCEFLIK